MINPLIELTDDRGAKLVDATQISSTYNDHFKGNRVCIQMRNGDGVRVRETLEEIKPLIDEYYNRCRLYLEAQRIQKENTDLQGY